MTTVIELTFQDSDNTNFREEELDFGCVREPTTSTGWSLRNWMALYAKRTENIWLHTSDLRGGWDFWKAKEWIEWWAHGMRIWTVKDSKSEPEEGKDHLTGNGNGDFLF